MVRIIILLLVHIVGDYFLQGSKLSEQKAVKISYLFEHVVIYTSLLIVVSPLALGLTFLQGAAFSILNGSTHFIIDFFTSRLKIKYYSESEPKYIITMGIDHSLHLLILFATYLLLFPDAISAGYILD
ncbi:MAG TPA: DUF3307 domain-containing protein [Paludibacter sp.]|nr:DUF3307 domain-containing protein [Paludibacter sp.]